MTFVPTAWNRRHVLGMLAAAVASGPLSTARAYADFAEGSDDSSRLLPDGGVCGITPEAVEGPYYVDAKLMRSDIRESKTGVPVRFRLRVVDPACKPIVGARVDVWHCDAPGLYSNYAGQGDDREHPVGTVGETFLRGTQIADQRGIVEFRSIYPGWYPGRTPHVHLKVFIDRANVLTGQFFFPDALSEFIYRNVAPYSEREPIRDALNDGDFIAKDVGRRSFASVTEEDHDYLVALVIGTDRAARSTAQAGGPPPFGGPPGAPPFGGPPGSAAPWRTAGTNGGARPNWPARPACRVAPSSLGARESKGLKEQAR